MSEDIDLDKMMADIFGAQKPSEEQKFYVTYNEMNRITGLGKYKGNVEESHILVDRVLYDELSNNTLSNYIVDKDNNTVTDISGSQTQKNSRLSEVNRWSNKSLVQVTFVQDTRQLYVNVRSQLPNVKKIWIVPRGIYMIPLLTLDLQTVEESTHTVPKFGDSSSCQLLSQVDIDSFTSYREVVNETDL